MDKLQPLIRHHFWILSGLIIPLVLYGFYSANGQLRAATQARESRLDQVKSGVSSGREANDDYITKLKFINGSLEAYVDDAIVDLWKHQQARMTWPRLVADRIPADFLGEFNQQVPNIYKGTYDEAYRRLQERVQPVRPLDPMVLPNPKASIGPNQKVVLMANLPQAHFEQFGVTSQEMWDAQIDIWMTELLLDSIVKVNQDKESVRESVVRRLDRLELLGGTGEPTTTDAGMSGEGGMSEFEGGMGGMRRSGRGGMGANVKGSVAFNPAEEFGPASAAGAGGGDMGMDMGMSEGGTGGPALPKRYIGADDESKPFFERGFYMSVTIQQSKIADFIVQLANSDWPVQVRRFQVGANPYRVIQSRGTTDGFSGEMSDFNLPAFGSSPEGGFSGSSGNFDAGVYRSGDRTATLRPNPYAANLPSFAAESMNH
ncbi:MAG TPA: hypothetical protein VNQ76_07090, partial [Planctomicrobium sp.]|nr:hypothetical protein [Planctomicrobium sp.]